MKDNHEIESKKDDAQIVLHLQQQAEAQAEAIERMRDEYDKKYTAYEDLYRKTIHRETNAVALTEEDILYVLREKRALSLLQSEIFELEEKYLNTLEDLNNDIESLKNKTDKSNFIPAIKEKLSVIFMQIQSAITQLVSATNTINSNKTSPVNESLAAKNKLFANFATTIASGIAQAVELVGKTVVYPFNEARELLKTYRKEEGADSPADSPKVARLRENVLFYEEHKNQDQETIISLERLVKTSANFGPQLKDARELLVQTEAILKSFREKLQEAEAEAETKKEDNFTHKM